MVVPIVLVASINPAQAAAPLRTTLKTRTQRVIRKSAFVSMASLTNNHNNESYVNVPLSIAPLKASSFRGNHTSNTKEYRLQDGVQKIREIMRSKARGYDVDLEGLIMVDVIQRLGLEFYFREEMHAALKSLRTKFTLEESRDDKLYKVALSFRLLRQDGYHVAADIFNTFKDNDGKLNHELCKDVRTLLSLFESSQLSKPEEDILDEARDFSVPLLKFSLNDTIEQSKARIIENTLKYPYHKNLARLFVKSFLHDFDVYLEFVHDLNNEKEWVNEVKELARLEFDMAQMTYMNEIQQISRWKNELSLDKIFSSARIDSSKWCMWSLGILPRSDKSEERLELAKAVSFIYMIDDIFDGYGTYGDLYQFTKAISSWEDADITELPKCMKVCFKVLLEATSDFSSKIRIKHGWNPKHCLRKLWVELCNAYLIESKWNVDKYSPSPEEYLSNGIVSSGTHVVLAHAFFLLGEGINKKSIEELSRLPSILSSAATILRLWNDAGIHTDRSPDGIDGSYVDCYMKEQKNSSYNSAEKHVNGMISDAWKRLNKEYMSPTSPFSKDFKLACLNLARMVPIMYSKDESHLLQFMMEH